MPRNASGGWRITYRRAAGDAPPEATVPGNAAGHGGQPTLAGALPPLDADVAAGGDLELSVLLSPSTATLVTLRPQRPPVLRLNVSVGKSMVYGGTMQDVLVQLSNPTTKPLRAEVFLAGSHPQLVPPDIARVVLGTLSPGSTQRLRYPLRVPVVGFDGEMGVTVRARGTGTGRTPGAEQECRAAAIWKTLAPLTAELETERVDVGGANTPAAVQVRLTNRSGNPLSVTLHGSAGETVLTLPARRGPTIGEAQVAAIGTDPGLYPASVLVELHGVPLLVLNALVGMPVVCRRATTTPTIDGDLSDWQDGASITLGREDQWHGRTWGGPEDLSAAIYTRWDDANFYFACAVTQAAFTPPKSLDVWGDQFDTVQFAFQNGAKAGEAVADTEDRFALAMVGGKQATILRNVGAVASESGARVVIRRVGTKTYYEASIPWRELKVMPKSGQMLRFAVMVTHGDGPTRGEMVWGESLAEEGRPRIYPPLLLGK